MTTHYGIALFGAGRIGKVHAANIHAHVQCEVLHVVDPMTEAAEALAAAVGAAVSSVESALADPAVQAVVICSATDTHSELIERSMQAGKAVFCEKPIDLSLPRVQAVLNTVSEYDQPLLIGFNRRFDPAIRDLLARLQAGDVGDVELVSVISKDPSPPPLGYLKVSGGLFRDMTIHDFDMARHLLGEEPSTVSATAAALTGADVKTADDVDTAIITLQCPSGRMAVITNSRRASFGYDQRVEVLGSLGSIRTENVPASTLVLERAEGVRRETPMHFFLERYSEAYRLEWAHFVDVLDGKARVMASGDDGRKAMQLAEAAYQSLASGQRIELG